MSNKKKEEKRKKDKKSSKRRYKEKKKEEFEQFYKIGNCSLDNHKNRRIEKKDVKNRRHRFNRINIIYKHYLALR